MPSQRIGDLSLDAEIRITSGDSVAEFAALWSWLRDDPSLSAATRRVEKPVSATELGGGVVELLAVTLGSGGFGVTLARSLTTWLQTRRPDVSISVSAEGRSVELIARGLSEQKAISLVERVLEAPE